MAELTTDEKTFTAEYADGDYNSTMEIEATKDGLWIDYGVLVSWEWINQARLAVERDISEQARLHKPTT